MKRNCNRKEFDRCQQVRQKQLYYRLVGVVDRQAEVESAILSTRCTSIELLSLCPISRCQLSFPAIIPSNTSACRHCNNDKSQLIIQHLVASSTTAVAVAGLEISMKHHLNHLFAFPIISALIYKEPASILSSHRSKWLRQ